MKKNYFYALLFLTQLSFSQYGNVSTLAGDGSQGYSGDGGPATAAILNLPVDVVIDNAGNIYFTEITNCVVRKIATDGTISTVAGIIAQCNFSGDGGQATEAKLDFPTGLGIDANGNLYIADRDNNRIRKVDTNGVISTVAGNGSSGDSGDGGAATSAELNSPQDVTIDAAGNIYISDWLNNKIRKVDTSGNITTFAGTGTSGFSGDGGQATAANLKSTDAICIDASGNIYFSDRGNDRIRKIDTNGIITTIAGSGGFNAFSGDGGQATAAEFNDPNGIDIDADGNIYVVDRDNHRIRKITTDGVINTIVGTGSTGFSGGGFNGDGQVGTATMIDKPSGVAIDNAGNVIFSDYENQRIRMLASNTLSVNKFSLENTKLYPNPISADEQLTINSIELIRNISIYNALGQEVYAASPNARTSILNLDRISAGVYVIKLNSENNNTLNYKLIKK